MRGGTNGGLPYGTEGGFFVRAEERFVRAAMAMAMAMGVLCYDGVSGGSTMDDMSRVRDKQIWRREMRGSLCASLLPSTTHA